MPSMVPGNTAFTSRAEFYLCLARAFLPPRAPQMHRALVEDLADDLADLAGEIGYPIAEPLAQLRAAFGALPEPLALLQLYSKLFLTPPAPAALNAGMCLDGAVMGAIEQAYRRHGLARAEGFHDTPDHLASLLEFVAYLYAAAAETPAEAETLAEEAGVFLDRYVTSWLPQLCSHIARAAPGDTNPYAALARLLLDAANQDARRPEPAAARPTPPAAAMPAPDSGPEERAPLPCRACGAEFVPPPDLRNILHALQANGLGTEHLHMCPRCRGQLADHAVTAASRRATPSPP